jgi:hypothetical protein
MEILSLYREFLTGFHKRKLQRKKIAQEQLKQQLKEERKRLKQEVCITKTRTLMFSSSELIQLQLYFSFSRSSMAIKAVGYKTCQNIGIYIVIFVITGSGVI